MIVMSVMNSIESKADQFVGQNYVIKTIDFLPDVNNIGSGNKAYSVEICALYIEFRGSNDLDYNNWENSSQIIHQFAIDTARRVIQNYDGKILDQQASGILAAWTSNKSNINKAVKVGLSLNWLFKEKFADKLEKFPNFDYGIGIHESKALVVKNSVPGLEYDEDKISYISPAINFAMRMSNQLIKPNCVGISDEVYNKLYDDSKTVKKSFVLIPYQKNVWDDKKIKFTDRDVGIKTTKHHLDIEEQQLKTE